MILQPRGPDVQLFLHRGATDQIDRVGTRGGPGIATSIEMPLRAPDWLNKGHGQRTFINGIIDIPKGIPDRDRGTVLSSAGDCGAMDGMVR